MPVRQFRTFQSQGVTPTQMQTGDDELGTQGHTWVLDQPRADLAITRHPTLHSHHSRRSRPHHKQDSLVSKASTMRLLRSPSRVANRVPCISMHQRGPLLIMHQSTLTLA
jgi:hypothetical protein